MADSHADDPNTPVIHYDVRERFASAAYVAAAALGVGAVALGVILGIILAND